MLRLHLLRHAKSSWDDRTLADHERPLAARGERACKKLRRAVAESEIRPTLVLCSTATRARETLARISPALGEPVLVFDERLYHADAIELVERIRELPRHAGETMLVGHNPGLHDLARQLVDADGRSALEENLPTGALVTLDLRAGSWPELRLGEATLVRLVRPRELDLEA